MQLFGPAAGQDIATYKANGLKWGRTHGAKLATETGEEALASTYYDAIRVFQNLGELTGEDFDAEEAAAIKVYREYVFKNNGTIPGNWIFTDGLTNNALRGDAESKRAVILLATDGSYAPDITPLEWTAKADRSREVAYVMLAMMNAERLGEPRRDRLKLLLGQALGHYDQWFVSKEEPYIQPFMAGLTATALIRYYEQIDKDKRILPALKTGADWLWTNAWREKEQAFYYDTNSPAVGVPDLNQLVLPLFAWTYKAGGKPQYRLDRARAIFDGGVKGAYLDGAKQFNQNYYRGPEALKWIAVSDPLADLKAENAALKAKIQKAMEALK